jgi:hypothetical protein
MDIEASAASNAQPYFERAPSAEEKEEGWREGKARHVRWRIRGRGVRYGACFLSLSFAIPCPSMPVFFEISFPLPNPQSW